MTTWSPDPSIQTNANLGLSLPILAWVSQIVIVLLQFRPPAQASLAFAAVQLVLLVGGAVYAGKVVSLGRSNVATKPWWMAIIGLLIFFGTIVLVIVAAISSAR